MDHKNEILQLLDNIIVCGESVAKIGRILKDCIPEIMDAVPKKTNSNSAPAELPEKKQTAYDFADVRKAFSSKSHAGYTAEVKALINKYGAERLSDVKEADYSALMADLEAIG